MPAQGHIAKTTMHNCTPSRFEKLPGEIRNMIFSFTLIVPYGKIGITNFLHQIDLSPFSPELKGTFHGFACFPPTIKNDISFPLLRLNKSIHSEAIQYLYGHNTFHFHAQNFEALILDYPTGVLEFLSKLNPTARNAIRSVHLSVSQLFLNSFRWHPLCTYLASDMHLKRLQLLVICYPISARSHRISVQAEKFGIIALS